MGRGEGEQERRANRGGEWQREPCWKLKWLPHILNLIHTHNKHTHTYTHNYLRIV